MKIIWIRHGITDWNEQGLFQGLTDIPLNDSGREMARNCAAALRQWGPLPCKHIYTSPLQRAVETGRLVGQAVGIDHLQYDTRLMERDMGIAEGTYYPDFSKQYPQEPWPGVEDPAYSRARFVAFLADAAQAEGADACIAVVSHGNFTRTVLRACTGNETLHPLRNCSVCLLEYAAGQVQLKAYDLVNEELLEWADFIK